MTNYLTKSATQKAARFAGFLYLLLCITGGFAHGGIRFGMIVYGDPVTTSANILADDSLFRLGIMADLLAQIVMLFLPLALYRLLKSVNQKMALFMVIAGYMGIPVTCINMLNQTAATLLLSGADYLSVFSMEQLQAMAMFFLEMQKYGYLFAHLFFGIWLFPMGFLVFKSGFLPRFLGIWLVLGGCLYIIQTFMIFHFPQLEETISGIAGLTGLSEIVFCLWLLIRGVNQSRIELANAPKLTSA